MVILGMKDMGDRYLELREEAATVGQEILDRYRDEEHFGRQTGAAASEYGLETEQELIALVGQPDRTPATSYTAAQLYGCDITDRVRAVPFDALPPEDQDDFFWMCAVCDNRQYDSWGEDPWIKFGEQYGQAKQLYDEFGTLVSRDAWRRYLQDKPLSNEETDAVFTALRERGVGDRPRPPDGGETGCGGKSV